MDVEVKSKIKGSAETLQKIIEDGLEAGAGVIHVELKGHEGLVRCRIGNTLRDMQDLSEPAQAELISHLKKLSKLDDKPIEMPQEGRFETPISKQNVEIEVSIMPVFGGEKAVLRLLPQVSRTPSLEQIGFWGEGLNLIRESLTHPHGLVLVAGPKRSGVSTTLHSLLDLLNTPMAKIAAVEKRGGLHIPGALQTFVDTNEPEAVLKALRETLDQESPDIAMIGRLPDKKTVALATETATQKRLILAGLHASGAIDALYHIRELGVEPHMLASSVRLNIGQRLVRRLCPDCKERYELTADERKKVEKSFDLTSTDQKQRVHELEKAASESGMGSSQLNSTASHITHLWKAKENGCKKCYGSGFQSIVAITEVLPITDNIQKLLASAKANKETLRHEALEEGFIPLTLDGLIKSLRGQTTVEEVLRACGP